MRNLIVESKDWKRKAQKLLDESKLVEELAQFGKVATTGAFRHDLMMTPDIDLYVTVENPTKYLAKKIINYLIDQNWWHNVLYCDWLNFRYQTHQYLPEAYYICLKTSVGIDRWKVDIWILNPDQAKKYLDIFHLDKITVEQKNTILILKDARNKDQVKLGSYDIYDAVINHNIKTLSSFKKFLQK